MARIIILSRASELFDFVGHALVREGHQVRSLDQEHSSVATVGYLLPDLIIVDGETAISPTKKLRAPKLRRRTLDHLRILVIRPATRVSDDHLQEGEAYLDRPLEPQSLIAFVNAMVESKATTDPKGQIVIASIKIDPLGWRVTRSGRLLAFTVPQFRLLYYLASHPGVTFRRDELSSVAWSTQRVAPGAVEACVRDIRRKIEEDPKRPRLIFTSRGHGYRLQIPESRTLGSNP
jgi:two-component system, OmpR family, alkaline phosphatase synthesis response regulator PhoP